MNKTTNYDRSRLPVLHLNLPDTMFLMRRLVLTFFLLVIIACSDSPEAATPDEPRVAETSVEPGETPEARTAQSTPDDAPVTVASENPTKRALLIGVNAYPNLSKFSQLKGAINDAERMFSLLTTKFEFPPENVTVLRDPTRQQILDGFQTLIDQTQAGDIVVFHYSGHGSQLKDQPEGDETDGLDETLVPSDSDRHGSKDIRDDEIKHGLASGQPLGFW